MNIQKNPSFEPTHNTSARHGKIEYLVIHYTGSTGDAKANINYFNQSTTRNASADFFVGHNGDIWQYNLDLKGRYCWAVGGKKQSSYGGTFFDKANNPNCVSIEMCCKQLDGKFYFTDATIKSTIELARYLMDEFNIPLDRVIRHYDRNGKSCPGVFGWIAPTGSEAMWNAFKDSLERPNQYNVGWNRDSRGWWYADSESSYYKNTWAKINHHWYYFGEDGYIYTGWHTIKGEWYYFEPTDEKVMGALYHTDSRGAQSVWWVE